MSPQEADAARIGEILGAFYAGRIERNTARSSVIDVVMARIRCQRVSLWKFEGGPGRLRLLCFAAKTAGEQLDTTERRLDEDEYRDYFNALIERGTYVSGDALNDRALAPMREPYLVAHHVRALLDAAFTLNGRAYGMVCCEQTSAPRDWRAGEVMALRAIVTRLALLMSGAPESLLWTTPSLPLQALEPPGRAAAGRPSP